MENLLKNAPIIFLTRNLKMTFLSNEMNKIEKYKRPSC